MRSTIKFALISCLILTSILLALRWPLPGLLTILASLFALGLYDIFQKEHTILRNFPVLGHIRYLSELISPQIHQYFVEDDLSGKPINRNIRGYIYARAKLENESHPFGTEKDVLVEGFEWLRHSIYPEPVLETKPRVRIGGPDCRQPYESSLFNISAMSFGSLSSNAVQALNLGAKAGGFSHNTGEGGVSDYHLLGGDLVWEIGSGYFGCRRPDGRFDADKFRQTALRPEIKMIEIKLSQGAKPGHGGVLPAVKNTVEIARIRGVEPHTEVVSPAFHSAFSDAKGLLHFVESLRELSEGKPVGIKLCVGSREEFIDICEAMCDSGIHPDYINVDGTEGGTGAAPIIFSDSVGMPWEQGLVFVVDTLTGYGLRESVKVLTATRLFTAFDLFKALCLGADAGNSARGMMLALGCIHSLRCHTNECPTGVTSSKASLRRGLVVEEKWKRVRNYQNEVVEELMELMAAAGCRELSHLNRSLLYKRVNSKQVCYSDIYPPVGVGSLRKQAQTGSVS